MEIDASDNESFSIDEIQRKINELRNVSKSKEDKRYLKLISKITAIEGKVKRLTKNYQPKKQVSIINYI